MAWHPIGTPATWNPGAAALNATWIAKMAGRIFGEEH